MKKHDYNYYYLKLLKKLRFLKKAKLYNLPKIKGFLFEWYSSLANRNFDRIKPQALQQATSDVIVSLTSYGERVNSVWMTLMTIFRQSILPLKVVLYLDYLHFSSDNIPETLVELSKKYPLEIRFCEDLGPHTKYFHAFLDYPNSDIVVCDDDVFYPSDWLETLLDLRKQYPNCICCNLAHRITFNAEKEINKYSSWVHFIEENGPSLFLCALGTGGVLYPRNCLYKDIFDKSFIKDNCLKNDDLWLKTMSILRETRTVKSSKYKYPFLEIKGSSKTALSNINNGQNRNDEILKAILSKYSDDLITNLRKADD